jgi:hypothetical protein
MIQKSYKLAFRRKSKKKAIALTGNSLRFLLKRRAPKPGISVIKMLMALAEPTFCSLNSNNHDLQIILK